MNREMRGTRRASSLALVTCALLLCAAETGGAIAPPCAYATPTLMVGPSPTKPVGDPDTPDEGSNKNAVLAAGGSISQVGTTANTSTESSSRLPGPFAWLASWIRSILGISRKG
jgi:hypothetical protein